VGFSFYQDPYFFGGETDLAVGLMCLWSMCRRSPLPTAVCWAKEDQCSLPDRGRNFTLHYHVQTSGRTVVLGSTQPVTEISTMNISWWIKPAGT